MARRIFKSGKAKDNTSLKFDNVLALISIVGFMAIVLNSLFGIGFINENSEAIILVLLGFGLMIEGQLRKTLRGVRDGVNPNEFAKVITLTVGIFILVVGIISFFFMGPKLDAFKGFSAIIAIVWIAIEVFLVK